MKKLIIVFSLVLVLFLSWSKVLDIKAKDYNIQTIKDVTTTLAITRGINAALSVVQNSSILVGIGVQADVAIGQIVNPINDFLDRFSWVLLFSLISLGIQDLIIALSQTLFINLVLSVSIGLFLFSIIKPTNFDKILYKIMIFLVFIRFAVPMIELINGYIYQTMMQHKIITIQEKNKQFNQKLQELLPTNTQKLDLLKSQLMLLDKQKDEILNKSTNNMNYFDKLKAKLNYNNSDISDKNKQQLIDIDNKIKLLNTQISKFDINPIDKIEIFLKTVKHNMDNFFSESYTTIILFLARGIVFPLLFLWILIKLGQNILKERDELFTQNGKTCKI